MNRRIWSVRRLAPLGVLALIAGAAGAQAASGGSSSAKPVPPRAMSAPVPVAPAPFGCRPAGRKPAAAPPSDALKNAFGILRRERTDDDALPARALQAIERRGLEIVDPNASRLLRADRRARAWVVPVPDVAAQPTVVCRGAAARRRAAAPGAAAPKPREGLAVVAVEGAPSGGGGGLRDLQRGLAPPAVDPCAGANRDMVGVSGIVPDGVEAVFVTSPDGSATRADVHDNGYAFVLPRSRRPDARYLVWTAANGTPHVQPLPAFAMFAPIGRCRGNAVAPPRVTPDPWAAACGPLPAPIVHSTRPMRAMPLPPRRLRRARPGRSVVPARPLPAPMPAPMPLSMCSPMDAMPMVAPPMLSALRPLPPSARIAPRAPGAPRAPRARPAPGAPVEPAPAPPRAP